MHLTLDVGKERSAKQEEHNSGGNEKFKISATLCNRSRY